MTGIKVNGKDSSPLKMVPIFIKQLKSYRNQYRSKKQLQYLEDDIKGYEMLMQSNSENNARKFLELKMNSRLSSTSGVSFANNLEVIAHMKEKGLWENAKT